MLRFNGVWPMWYFLIWIILAVLVGMYAGKKGRSTVGFFLLSLVLSPLIGFLAALVAEPQRDIVAANAGMKKCPECGEYVQGEARICRFCRHEFWPQTLAASPANEPTDPPSGDFDPWPRSVAASESAPSSPNRRRWRIALYGIAAAYIILILILGVAVLISLLAS